ncbi:CLUMA_CG015666, isoform A [Clunio marinus]|uniref:CLUMA_CG015666, isoform A n=1 Tax=Clunio marinus TaxID=568069 RepID=A0A1J1IQE0_9DIPT|nr:CLUMA_CG015666, isoform A [Clunio marinus]
MACNKYFEQHLMKSYEVSSQLNTLILQHVFEEKTKKLYESLKQFETSKHLKTVLMAIHKMKNVDNNDGHETED